MGLAARPISAIRRSSSAVDRDARSLAAEDERWPHDHAGSRLVADLCRLVERVGEAGRGHRQADLGHGRLEALAVLGRADGLDARADELDAEPIEHAVVRQLHRQVERGLAADGGQQRVGALALDDGGEHLDVEWFDVGAVRRSRGRS